MLAILNRKAIDPRALLEEKVRFADLHPAWTPNVGRQPRAQWWWRYGQPQKRRVLFNDRTPDRRLRVGYVSGDYNLHSACTVFGPILLSHSADFEAFCYSTTPPETYDPTTQAFTELTNWRDVWGWTDDDVASLIQIDEIDILVDCSGFTPNNRLPVFAMKPAPVQVNAWGYVYPTTFPCFDAIFSDKVCIKEDERHNIERVVDLPCVLHYADRQVFVETNELPCLSAPPMFGTFNRIAKIDDHALFLWREILNRVPGAMFTYKSGDKYREKKHDRLFEVLGESRVALIPPTGTAEHAAQYQRLDLNLDPIAMNGGVTSMESLWMGVPMVTLPGGQTSTRMSETLLRTIGLPEFVASSDEDYVRIAVEWVTTRKAELAAIRTGLRERVRTSPLNVGYVDAVERAYRRLWKEWCSR